MNKTAKAPNTAYPIKLIPHIVTPIWGSETWLLSVRENAAAVAANGSFAGATLRQLFEEHPALFGTKCGKDFPLLVKFIDAQDDLSIQVHPRDSDTEVLKPGEAGKTECWYVLSAKGGSKIYLGFRDEITPEKFARAIEKGNLSRYVQAHRVKRGDFYYIPAGTLHAIGKGVHLAEVQQNSDTTYRVFDYNRLQDGKPRPLHVEQACAVTDLQPYYPLPYIDPNTLVKNELFTVKKYGPSAFSGHVDDESFASVVVTEGSGILHCEGHEPLALEVGDSLFLPAGLGEFSVEGRCRILDVRL